MESNLLNIYSQEINCAYKDETYKVRDNGAVFRLKKKANRKRRNDEKWTFGKANNKTGYMNISSERVHRIVATAFHGSPPSAQHVVDHIDTNRQNNRPENLRWLTKLENVLLNPISLARVIHSYGSIERFLEDPSKPIKALNPNIQWMRTVSKEEAESSKQNLLTWSEKGLVSGTGSLGDWIFSSRVASASDNSLDTEPHRQTDNLTESLTEGVKQKNWSTPTEFPNCPNPGAPDALERYKNVLEKGALFSTNRYAESRIKNSEIHGKKDELIVQTSVPTGTKPHALARIYLSNGAIIHESLGSFMTETGAEKRFTIALGREWNGEDSIDDYMY